MSRPSAHPLHLSGDLSLRNISELHARLRQALVEHRAIDLDTVAVESVDIGTLQLLVSATTSAAADNRTLSLVAGAATPMGRALVRAGFFTGDGRPLVAALSSWILTREAA
ncbi:MAG TPA: STAS domain-containing protein [Devosia sp.]|jgi:ABC-type transporter Mla MlaB component|uniref:STAS domain-containing protein n=1 Tax=Devosia sp. TaxID=1871048 RepID=UPI002DDC935D|nr:STAS domain-containing protein [Devosia sp.]HEV2518447.1 STAS domain-containing protein [Devosia sp.]